MIHHNKIWMGWGWFHRVFIFFICSYSAYSKYCRYTGMKENQTIKTWNSGVFFNLPMLYYGKYTGTSTGYGFFAPNVKSGGFIIGDCDGKKIEPQFRSFEGQMRFSVLASRITDYLLTNDSSEIHDRSLKDKYYSLVFKSVAVKMYNQARCTGDTAYVSYNIFKYPALRDYRVGYHQPALQTIKEICLTHSN